MHYGLCLDELPPPTSGVFDLFAGEGDTTIENAAHTDKVNDFFMLTEKPDCLVSDILLWWKHQWNHFPTLSMIVMNTLIIRGSSVASELTFRRVMDLFIQINLNYQTNISR